jgi:ADP-ribosylglycohydrolase
MHAVGPERPEHLAADAELVTRITHGSPAAIAATAAVAWLISLAAREAGNLATLGTTVANRLGEGATATALRDVAGLSPDEAIARLGNGDAADAVVATAYACAAHAEVFEDAVFAAVNAGGAADARGAITGAIYGAHHGIAAIPQRMIDQLEGRIYVSLAVPWFYRTALRHAGLVIDLQPDR